MVIIIHCATRRRYLASVAALLAGATAGCTALDTSAGTTREPTTTTTGRETTETTRTTQPTTTTARTTTPTLNRTEYPTVQQPTETDEDLIPGQTVILADSDWRDYVSTSILQKATTEFIEATDFQTHYLVGFEVPVTEWGYYLRLDAVKQSSNRVRVEYADVFVRGGPNVEMEGAMFVRLPRENGVPREVTLHRTDESE
jgi:hypothetical protein